MQEIYVECSASVGFPLITYLTKLHNSIVFLYRKCVFTTHVLYKLSLMMLMHIPF